ncbi:helix-turn-helix domain-containing protein [Asticcacaulis excentricus]|nr:helix-turn-helix domain-containing protein [Asticcacaulis excentricus]
MWSTTCVIRWAKRLRNPSIAAKSTITGIGDRYSHIENTVIDIRKWWPIFAIGSTSAGKAFLQMLGVFAEFETSIRKERQLEGIATAKQAGVYKGRKPSVPVDEIKRLASEGMGATAIAKTLQVGRASVYRTLSVIDGS